MHFALTRFQYLRLMPIASANFGPFMLTGLGSGSIAWFVATAINKSKSHQLSPSKPTLKQDMESYVWW
ncbi:hypothetical protein K493DRAFT_318767 [Basidiobolus meristosporus CBS 931.73]|uniref:Uncharacterized protein n=1 Tax=Basidiobolus meristosporus CBS 931.73 TaxID=1314790 RepID=A0A1Y1XUF5_9FUNG|nr:hypothetical protein K493DRAFT_318767 [Basidiobolus meristosporus CBS 931.73]|eukprot:ORX89353.1 hypothetical protein K493DRAFT_318767 [Basidiobolus meristosporus CBS 931.73]